jgi:crotonobetainyl-CoA:carnitine CoA-transferase CaiB-like acyl-CoA transferase
MLPLTDIRVVELGTVLMAPYAGQWLADMGADVIKVEPPGGDQTRVNGPSVEAGMSPMFLALNRNKRSIMLDLASGEDRNTLDLLIAGADVLIHNIRDQKLVKLGIDAARLTAKHPRLIYAGLQGFSRGGAYSGRPAYDDIIQGMSGTADLIRRQTGALRYAPMVLADKISGIVAALAIAAAIASRERTGKGLVVEAPMFETMVAFNMLEHFCQSHFATGNGDMGYRRTLAGGRGPYRTLNGHISFMPYTDRQWSSFFEGVGRIDLSDDVHFGDHRARMSNVEALYGVLGQILGTRTSEEWLAFAEEAQIPAAPVLSLEDIVDDPHLSEVEFFAATEDESMGQLRYPGVPLTFNGVRPTIRQPPRLDEHREEILAELERQPGISGPASGGNDPGLKEVKMTEHLAVLSKLG